MDRRVRQEAHRLSIPRPWRWGPSSDGSAAIEPPAEALGRRGGTRSRGLQRRIFTADKGSPHFERHWRFADGSSAFGPCENREYGAISRSQNKGRPDRGLSSLRYLTAPRRYQLGHSQDISVRVAELLAAAPTILQLFLICG